jgi:CspA family cold shock protein
VPTGRVKFFDADRGFGFVSIEEGGEGDVFVPASALPAGVTTLKGGARIEFSIAEGRRGAQALAVRLLDPAPSVAVNRRVRDRKPADEMVVIVEDVIKLLDSVSESLAPRPLPRQGSTATRWLPSCVPSPGTSSCEHPRRGRRR